MSYYNKNVHNKVCQIYEEGFPGSLTGKESACNAEDPSLIPGSGRSPREVTGYPLQYSRASSVAQLVKNLPVVYYHVRIESPVYVRRRVQHAWGWCTVMTQRDVMGREVEGGFMFGNACTPVVDSCQCMAKPIQYCKVK